MATVHASSVLTGRSAVLIRGPSGSGKSYLALALIEAADCGRLSFARLVADDRTEIATAHGRLLLRPPASIAGLVEVHGLGLRRLPFEAVAVAGLVIDLAAADAARAPPDTAQMTEIAGVRLPRLAVAAGVDALASVLAMLHSEPI